MLLQTRNECNNYFFYYNKSMALNNAIQALIAVSVVLTFWIVLIPLFFTGSMDKAPAQPGVKERVNIIEGRAFLNNNEIYMDTMDESAVEYVNLPRSNDIKGGAQFSYSFWMNKFNTVNASGRVLLLRGVKQPAYVVKASAKPVGPDETVAGPVIPGPLARDNTPQNYKVIENYGKDVVIKCPLIKFGVDENELVVQFNTTKNPHNEIHINAPILKTLGSNVWSLLTFTFEDYFGMDGFESGVVFKFFINDSEMYSQRFANDALLVNNDPIYLFPVIPTDRTLDKHNTAIQTRDWSNLQGSIADVSYYNYALTAADLNQIIEEGFNNTSYTTPSMKKRGTKYSQYYHASLSDDMQKI